MRTSDSTFPIVPILVLGGFLLVIFAARSAQEKKAEQTALEQKAQLEALARLKCPTEAQKLLVLEALDHDAHPGCKRAYQTLMEGDAVPVARCIADDREFAQGTALCVAPNLSIGAPIAWNVTTALLPQNGGGH